MAQRKKSKPAKAKQPAKQNTRPAQEVQGVTLPKNNTKDIVFFALQAEYLMKQAIKHYNKPETEVFFIDALNMFYDDIKGDNMTDKDITEAKENAANIKHAAETLTGKDKEEITLADLQAVIKEHLPEERAFMPPLLLSDEELDALNAAIYSAVDLAETAKAIKEAVTTITQSIDFKAVKEGIKCTLSFLADLAQNADQISEISGRALEFEREILPFIMLEIAERTGYKYAFQLSFEDVRRIMLGEATPEEYNEEFENAFNEACEQFELDGTPTSQYGHELLEAAAKRKAALIKGEQTIGTLVNLAEAAELLADTTTDTKQAEQIKKKLPELKEELKELQRAYLPIVKGKPTDSLLFANKNPANIDDITHVATLKAQNIDIFVENYNKVLASLNVSTDKFLQFALYQFTKNNDFKNKKGNIDCSICFDLRDYAYLRNYDVFPHNNTDKEKRRANKKLDKVREEVNKNLDLLFSLSVSWKDKESKTSKDKHDFNRVRLLSERGQIKNNVVYFSFTPVYAAYLANRNIIGQYPAKLLGMDSRKPTPYKIAKKLFDHFFIDNNIINETNDILSIKALLPFSGLATFEEVQEKDRGHWIERIKEPLETALDELTQMEILKDWEYCHEKKKPLTDKEAQEITDYYDYEALYLHFIPFDELDQSERIEKKQQQIIEAQERKEKRKQAAIKRNIKKKSDKEKGAGDN